MASHKTAALKLLHDAKLNATLARIETLCTLLKTEAALTTTDIHIDLLKRGVTFSLAAIYQSIAKLHSAGIVTQRHFEGRKALYTIMKAGHQAQFTCERCGRIYFLNDPCISKFHKQTASRAGFFLHDFVLSMRGYCGKKCADPSDPPPRSQLKKTINLQ